MPPNFSLVKGAYLRDLMDQPQVLAATLSRLRRSLALHEMAHRLRCGEFHRVVLTGMGSSYHALHPLNLQLIAHGFTSLMEETSELVYHKSPFVDPGTLIIAVSQSGRSAEVVRLVEAKQGCTSLIAVTNTPDSPLARAAAATVLTHAGGEHSVACKTSVTALMALQWLGDLLCAQDLDKTQSDLARAAPAVEGYLRRWEEHVGSLIEKFRDVQHLFLAGRGSSLAAVGIGGLVVKESDHFHAEGMS